MREAQPQTIYLKDYQPPAYWINQVKLRFELGEDETLVEAELEIVRNTQVPAQPLTLNGQDLQLLSIAIDEQPLPEKDYQLDDEFLTIDSPPDGFLLTTRTRILPHKNTALEGLYKSNDMFCTQCEAEGFRRITYYLDRPDVMARFETTVVADKQRYPVLLSNGNPIAEGELDDGRHWVTWEDPFKKPCYLFALVAGDLVKVEDSFTTCTGRHIPLRIFVEARNIDKCDHAMASLKKAMAWDEEVYGREYDLDIFMIVAVDAFNMGAMENKGLNIFNSSCVLANPKTATDLAYERIEAVVAHEYFHNWSGNRVTCRDWFQLSLKEGFTVFRDAEFSADMNSRLVKRIDDSGLIRTMQFAEDGGPLAHPVRPASYMEISNFYTLTIYEKGAEVVRMLHSLLGPEAFRRGSDLYFARHDGEAATIEDFIRAMAEVSGLDLSQFERWYDQAGTPELQVSGTYDAEQQCYTLRIQQSCPPSPGQAEKLPYHIPFKLGLLNAEGQELPMQLDPSSAAAEDFDPQTQVLQVRRADQTFLFRGIKEAPVPSLLRDFSAPVKLQFDYSQAQLLVLMAKDSNQFNRWDAGQRLASSLILAQVENSAAGKDWAGENQAAENPQVPLFDAQVIAAYQRILHDRETEQAALAAMLSLPKEAYLAELCEQVDVDAIHQLREQARRQLAGELSAHWLSTYQSLQDGAAYEFSADAVGRRSLKNLALSYLTTALADDQYLSLAEQQFKQADNMTDMHAALMCLVNGPDESRAEWALTTFHQQWQNDPLVMDQWFSLQASCQGPGSVERVEGLTKHPNFDLRNPNKVRSLLGAFANQNHTGFHRLDGAGYALIAAKVLELDALNPQIASRLVIPLTKWRRYGENRQIAMRKQLESLISSGKLSKDLYEVLSKSL